MATANQASGVGAPWAGRLLFVDLSRRETHVEPTPNYTFDYLGGRGLAARLAWDLIRPGVGAYDRDNVLFLMVGALVGTPAPSAGRVTVSAISPQAHPHEWYTRSNVGGHWGAELKFAGYDGLVVSGRAEWPVYLSIEDDKVELRDARELWGQGLVSVQLRLRDALAPGFRVLAIGPAGENLCRFSIIATGTESAAGQGGFGAVMGSKNLKAIAVRGHGGVRVAQPTEMLRRSRAVVEAIVRRYGKSQLLDDAQARERGARLPPCTYQCPRACGSFYQRVAGAARPDRKYGGHFFCCAPYVLGKEWEGPRLSFEAAYEIAQICNDLGINHWEYVFGLVPWILRCQARGELLSVDGHSLNLADPSFWIEFLEGIARRQGWAAPFADGGPRAAQLLGVGQDIIAEVYPAWGQASHWDGHGSFPAPYYPYWVVPALQWCMDTRDPMGGGHGYTTNVFGLMSHVSPGDETALSKLRAVGEYLYGSAQGVDPHSGCESKAAAAIFHQDRGALKDSLGICDNIFPLLTDPNSSDWLVHVPGADCRDLEHWLFEPAAERGISPVEFRRIGARVYTAERMLAIRNWGRDRATDETMLPYLARPEETASPFLASPVGLEPAALRSILDEYYSLRGWDVATARPTARTLRELGMSEYV